MLDGRYRIERRLGGDADRAVDVAVDVSLGRRVVIKSAVFASEAALTHLRREGAMLMAISPHPGLPVARHDFADDTRYHLVIDHVEGIDLADLVRMHGSPGLPMGEALRYLDQVGGALDHLHAQPVPVVHGDLKPENVVVTADGRAVVIDFGTASLAGSRATEGTPGFSAPEAMGGEVLAPAADVFSLAAVATFVLTGAPPHWGSPTWVGPSTGPSEAVFDVLRRALSFDPDRRPRSAGEMMRRLREVADGEAPNGLLTVLSVRLDDGSAAVVDEVHAALAQHSGVPVMSARVPKGGMTAVFRTAGEALAGAWAIADLVAVRGRGSRIGLHVGDVGGWRGQPMQELIDALDPLLAATPAGSVACSPALHRLLIDDTDHRATPFLDGYLLSRTMPTSLVGVDDALRLAEDSLASGRPERALDVALGLVERDDAVSHHPRARLVAGQALLALGRSTDARSQLRQAGLLAERHGDGGTFALAAITAARLRNHGQDNPDLRAFVELALEQVPTDQAYVLAQLRVCQASLLPPGQPHDRRMVAARRALSGRLHLSVLERARIDLAVSQACSNPDDAAARAAVASSVLAVGDLTAADVRIEAFGHRAAARLQLGDVAGALADNALGSAFAAESGHRFLLARLRLSTAAIAVLQGQHDEGARLATEAVELSNGRPNAVISQAALHWQTLRAGRRYDEIREIGGRLAVQADRQPLMSACLAAGLAEAGMTELAREVLDSMPAVRTWPRDWFWLATATATLQAAVSLGDPTQVRRLTVLLGRYHGQLAVAGAGSLCLGPVVAPLGSAGSVGAQS